jgi:glycosyltransferase involved in cell wall biosynthesis
MADPPLLFVSYAGVLGGAERVLLDCVTRLDREITVACPEGPLAAALKAAGIAHTPVKERPLELGAGHAGGIAGLALELRRHKPEFIVAWGARAVLATALTGRRWLAVHHDLLPSAAVRGAVRTTTKRANGVAAASHAIAAQFEGPVTVLHPGVDLTRFTPQPLPGGPPHALVLGALVAWKRPELALEIAEHMPELRITIAGTTLPGDDPPALEATPRVTLAGQIDDVPEALAQAHLLLHCADAEPYGMVLVEALAAGRPVVAPDGGGPREIVADGAGALYRPGDAEAAADAIRAVLADPQAPANARRRAEAHFDVADSARRLEHAIQQAMR